MTGVLVPIHIKNLLPSMDFDNSLSFGAITDLELTKIEEYARGKLREKIGDVYEQCDYYGKFEFKQQEFQFSLGERVMIKALAKFVSSKSNSYWRSKILRTQVKAPVVKPSRRSTENSLVIEQSSVLKSFSGFWEKNKNELKDIYPLFVDTSYIKIETESTPDGQSKFILKMTCPVCKTVKSLNKRPQNDIRKARWVFSNLHEHIKKHKMTSFSAVTLPPPLPLQSPSSAISSPLASLPPARSFYSPSPGTSLPSVLLPLPSPQPPLPLSPSPHYFHQHWKLFQRRMDLQKTRKLMS